MFTNNNEEQFFLQNLKAEHKVLEYGSGESTLQIAKRVKELISIEHQKHWYDKLISKIPENCILLLHEPDLPYIEGGEDGLYQEFESYVNAPIAYAPFDVILIDGRARVSCASLAKQLGHKNTIVFIHDFHRPEYKNALNYLEVIDSEGSMFMFKIK